MKKIQFIDFWDGFDRDNNWFTLLFDKFNYEYKIVENQPDIIILASIRRKQSINFDNYKDIVKIHYTGENNECFNNVDLNLTFKPTNHNNIRLPNWIIHLGLFANNNFNMSLSNKTTNQFCCFVYSHNVKQRNAFVHNLNKYKRVDCGGNCINNIGHKIKDKIEFQKIYKFCIAYENCSSSGYITEKIFDAYASNCIPIYYGTETVTQDFNPETFINGHDFDNEEDLINYVIKVDTDENLYNSFMNKPIFSKKWLEVFNDPNETYFKNIAAKILN
jgi:alpha(1,3/1,4) fucosyltransferase